MKLTRVQVFGSWLASHWNPILFARRIVMFCVYAVDSTNFYRFLYTVMSPHARSEPMSAFGITIPWSVATFESTALGWSATLTIYFISNTLADRLARRFPVSTYWLAMIVGCALSALANGGALFYDVNDLTLVQVFGGLYVVPIFLGVVIMFGLLFYASMDAWDKKRKIEEDRARKEAKQLEALHESPSYKHSRTEYKQKLEQQLLQDQFNTGLRRNRRGVSGDGSTLPRVPRPRKSRASLASARTPVPATSQLLAVNPEEP
jgi:uncharacterized membrane protein